MKQFNVIIENNGKFEPYDIMQYLKNSWYDFTKSIKEYGENDWYKYPKTLEEIKAWVKRTLKYQYWARCEYEIIISTWPSYTNSKGEEIIRKDKSRKIDIYDQCEMNIDTITELFIGEILAPYEMKNK